MVKSENSTRESVKASYLSRASTVLLGAILAVAFVAFLSPVAADAAASLPPGFQEEPILGGLDQPMNVEFSKDGRVFVAEKSGLIKVFDNPSDTTPTTFDDLRTKVHSFWDRGMLGMALDPNFPTNPYVYVLYTHDAAIGGTAPRWGAAGATSDQCPTPPGATEDGCVVSGRLSRLEAAGNTTTGTEKVLIEDWCQQYPSHSVGDLAFGADGALYVSGGDGASFNFADYGQDGNPLNPCGDPPTGAGGTQTPPTAQGGSLRAQDLRTPGDPVTLDGSILRVDPATGAALPGNPFYGSGANAGRVVAYGLRNPFRFAIRPGTSEVWLGDVGAATWEEVNRVAAPGAPAENFGWPCYEGGGRQPDFDSANLSICEDLYGAAGATTGPYYAYNHAADVVPGETCPPINGEKVSSSISGMAFYGTGPYPDRYDDALFFADYARNCVWAMEKGANGLPDLAKRATFVAGASGPVDLEIGPDGDLFYVSILTDTVRRIRFFAGNQPPVAQATANPASGPTPLAVNFDGTGSRDPDGDALSYAWDLDGDGAFDDSAAAKPTFTYQASGSYRANLRVADGKGGSDDLDQPVTISAGNTPPAATIGSPLATLKWKVGDRIAFSGSATDGEDGSLAASGLSWELILNHCATSTSCHQHPVQSFPGVAQGSFVAPDHEYPSHLVLRLTATDSGGLKTTKSVRLDPQTTTLNFRTNPTGLRLVVGGVSRAAPFSRTVIVGSTNSLSAPSPQSLNGRRYVFRYWSDGKAQTHNVVAPSSGATYTANYVRR